MEKHRSIELLAIDSNNVHDLTPLVGLDNMRLLIAAQNNISDISPLLDCPSLSKLHLEGNPLSEEAINVHIPQLEAKGVRVYY